MAISMTQYVHTGTSNLQDANIMVRYISFTCMAICRDVSVVIWWDSRSLTHSRLLLLRPPCFIMLLCVWLSAHVLPRIQISVT